jgi:hypothetical protein
MGQEMIPTRDDFIIKLRRMLETQQRCSDDIGEYVDIVALDLHKLAGYDPKNSKNNRFVMCCDVMNEMMRPGDEVLNKANTREGRTSAYKVRYRFPRII